MAKDAVKKTIRSLLAGTYSSGSKATTTDTTNPSAVTRCRACKVASNRQGMILPTRRFARLEQRNAHGDGSRAEIRGFIWGSGSGSDDDESGRDDGYEENEVLVNRVYSMLLLENSSVIDFLESHSGRGLGEMPEDMRKGLERAIVAQVQMS